VRLSNPTFHVALVRDRPSVSERSRRADESFGSTFETAPVEELRERRAR
jgi:hypothetical protein